MPIGHESRGQVEFNDKYDDYEQDDDVDDQDDDGHLCRLAMRADVKEWRCHFRSRDLIQHSEVGNEDGFEDEDDNYMIVKTDTTKIANKKVNVQCSVSAKAQRGAKIEYKPQVEKSDIDMNKSIEDHRRIRLELVSSCHKD